ncbi:ABC-F family ATP-binding cassette domain-containing protein [Brachybacterium nesterenkovii]|uniref:ABC-F family ATP-binding cassette domain-containing protein n=1 Tax=Brachybacterium nesterenkovii TaxID=47847 RepID=UPI00321A1214
MPTAASHPSALHLRVDGVSHAYAARPVLTDVSFAVPAGAPAALLGENGAGKSALLRLIAGLERPDRGEVSAPGPIGLLHQDLPFGPTRRVADVVADALERSARFERDLDAAAHALAAQPESPSTVRDYDDALAAATLADAWNAPHRAERVLAGLGLVALPRDRPIARISGGERERLALAHLLIARPTTLLLDEPTNHLDDAGAVFLAALLAEHPGPVLVASHDRAFVDEATRMQIDLDPAEHAARSAGGGVTVFTGTFTEHLHARLDARERWERRYAAEQEELRRLRIQERESHRVGHADWTARTETRMAQKFYADRNAAVVSRRVRDLRQRLETLERDQVRRPPAELRFTGLPEERLRHRGEGGVVIAASGVGVPGRLAPVSLALSAGEKLLVTGANGSGKSTLLAILVGDLEPATGTVHRGASLRIAHLAQDDHVDPDATARQLLLRAAGLPVGDREHVPELFGLIHPRELDRPLGELSRGQVRRAVLAALLADPPELLVLDEPTNHLALDLAVRLEDATQHWPGTVIVASHDRWLRRRWQGRTLALEEG